MANETTTFNKAVRSDVYKIDPRAIKVIEGFNSRSDFGDIPELASQIAEQGVLNPISVKKIDDEHYELIDGERRYRAVMYLIENGTEVARIPALILPKNINKEAMLLQQIMRNEGKPFNEYEYGVAYQKLHDVGGFTNAEIAQKVGKNRWHVDCCLAHLRRDERVQTLIRDNKMKGTEVRRIYQAYHNEEEAVKEILKLQEMHEDKVKKGEGTTKNGETKTITVGDLDAMSSKTVAKRESAAIKKGLNLLIKYYTKVSEGGKYKINIDPYKIVKELNDDCDRTIIDILTDLKNQSVKTAV